MYEKLRYPQFRELSLILSIETRMFFQYKAKRFQIFIHYQSIIYQFAVENLTLTDSCKV